MATCPTCHRPQLTEQPHVHLSPKTHRDPPTSPAPWADLEELPGFSERVERGRAQLDAGQRVEWLDPDPLTVDPEPVDERIPYHGWAPEPEPVRRPLLALALRVALIALVLAVLALLAAPRSAALPTSSSPDVDVRPGSAGPSTPATATSGAPLIGAPRMAASPAVTGAAAPQPRPEEPVPSPAGDVSVGPRYSAIATWCAPTPTQCQAWGGDARLGAVFAFRDGDAPWWARVWRGEAFVDVLVVSHCACGGTLHAIDVSPAAFELLAPLSRGRIDVDVERLAWPVGEGPPPNPADERMRLEVRDDEVYR